MKVGAGRKSQGESIERLRQDLQNGRHFDQITSELAELAKTQGRQERAALSGYDPPSQAAAASAGPESKKNSTKRRARRDTAKPKPFLRKSPRGSRSKA